MLLDSMIIFGQCNLLLDTDTSPLRFFDPIDDTRAHVIDATTRWHARLMSLAWSFFFPFAILAARFYKVTPQQRFPEELDNQWWWNTHRICVTVGSIAALLGLSLAYFLSSIVVGANSLHQYAGWVALALLCVQIFSGLLRGTSGGPKRANYTGDIRGDHFDMTLRRIVFERVHKSSGYVALACAWLATLAGLWSVNSPLWIWLLVSSWWMVLGIIGVRLQMQQRAIDTYQAIWGTHPALKGNQMTSIGVGVHRVEHRSDLDAQ